MTGAEGIFLSYRGRFEDKDIVLTEVEDAPQVGIISSEREIESSGRSREVRDNRLFSILLNDDVNDVLRSVFVDGSYVLSSSSSFEWGMLVDTERAKEGVVGSSREADSGCLHGTPPLGGDVNLEENFFVGKPGTGA